MKILPTEAIFISRFVRHEVWKIFTPETCKHFEKVNDETINFSETWGYLSFTTRHIQKIPTSRWPVWKLQSVASFVLQRKIQSLLAQIPTIHHKEVKMWGNKVSVDQRMLQILHADSSVCEELSSEEEHDVKGRNWHGQEPCSTMRRPPGATARFPEWWHAATVIDSNSTPSNTTF